ncbi:MAG: glycogen debranching enzyme, partial [Nitrospinae bacterium]|nr:glycogen debranching enzyme [Nitrospinota bacterium]
DWSLLEENEGLFRFCKELIAFRKRHPVLRRERFFHGKSGGVKNAKDISWHGVEPYKPDWGGYSRVLAVKLFANEKSVNDIYIIFNGWTEELTFYLPKPPQKTKKWHRVIDTSMKSPKDITEEGKGVKLIKQSEYKAMAQSIVVLISK